MTQALLNAPAWTQATPPLPSTQGPLTELQTIQVAFHPTTLCLESSSSTSCTLCSSNTQVSFTYHILKKAFHVTPTPDQIPRFIPSHHTMCFSFIGTYQFVIVHLLVQLVSELINITGRTVSGFAHWCLQHLAWC